MKKADLERENAALRERIAEMERQAQAFASPFANNDWIGMYRDGLYKNEMARKVGCTPPTADRCLDKALSAVDPDILWDAKVARYRVLMERKPHIDTVFDPLDYETIVMMPPDVQRHFMSRFGDWGALSRMSDALWSRLHPETQQKFKRKRQRKRAARLERVIKRRADLKERRAREAKMKELELLVSTVPPGTPVTLTFEQVELLRRDGWAAYPMGDNVYEFRKRKTNWAS